MDHYCHHVSGFFIHRDDAEHTRIQLMDKGLMSGRIQIFAAESAPGDTRPTGESTKVLISVLKDSAIGTAVGTGIGALAEVALVSASVSLFVASPLIAPLVMMGWGASLGGLVGAMVGTTKSPLKIPEKQDGKLSTLVHDAIVSGQFVLVVDTRSETETAIARGVIHAAVGEYNNVTVA